MSDNEQYIVGHRLVRAFDSVYRMDIAVVEVKWRGVARVAIGERVRLKKSESQDGVAEANDGPNFRGQRLPTPGTVA